MTIEKVGGSRRQDPVERVAALLGDSAGGQVVDLMEKLQALQTICSEGIEGPGGKRLQGS